MSLKSIYKDCRFAARDILINRKYRSELQNNNFSLITSDCLGGCIAKDLKTQMNSPTRNFYFNADDYVKFCTNLDYYLSLVPEPYTGNYTGGGTEYLMASLGDLKLFLVHYSSVEKCREEWLRRRERVNRNSLFFMMNDRNFCTEADIAAFDELPYGNKVCFTHRPMPQYKSTFYICGSENNDFVKTITDYPNQLWVKRYYDQFNFVDWLNNGGCEWPK